MSLKKNEIIHSQKHLKLNRIFILVEKRSLLDLNFDNILKPKAGLFLLSEPFLDSDYFRRSVILLCEHNEEGSFGFVLNNFLTPKSEGLPNPIITTNADVSIGGPVEISNLYFIHTFENEVPGSSKLKNGIFLGGDYEALHEALAKTKNPEKHVRYFLGYSGWDKNQLNREIEEKSWVVCQPKNNSWIMDTAKKDLWETCLTHLGGKYKMFAQFPLNPNNN
jgi:putative transcriptional regulator